MKDILIADKFKRNFLNGYSSSIGAGNDGNSSLYDWMIEDPTYLGFHIEIINEQIESPNAVACGLFLNRNDPFSATDYLDRIGESWRADLLEQFVNEFLMLVRTKPWFFTSIAGLNKVLNLDMKDAMRIGADVKIEIETLESLDMKIFRLFDMYRKATYDTINMRDMLPANMRKFNMRIHISEIRQFHTFTRDDKSASKNNKPQSPLMQVYGGIQDIYNLSADTKVGTLLNQGGEKLMGVKDDLGPLGNVLDQSQIGALKESVTKIVALDNFVSVMTINLSHCVFDFENYNSHLETITNSPTAEVTQKFSIKPMKVSETNTYPLSKMVLRDVIANSHFPSKIITVPQVISVSNGVPFLQETETNDTTKIDDIVKLIYPEAANSADTEEIKDRSRNDLLKGGVFDAARTVVGGYQGFKSDLEKRLESLGINFNPLNALESEIKNKAQQLLDGTILGNIHGLTSNNLINSVKNAINKIEKDKIDIKLNNIDLSSNQGTELIVDNINLTEQESNISITGNGLTGQNSNYAISQNGLTSTPPTNLTFDNADLTSIPSDKSIDAGSLTGLPATNLNFSNMNLTETIPIISMNDNVGLTETSPNDSISDLELTSNNSSINMESNIDLKGGESKSEISDVKFNSSTNETSVSDIKLTSNQSDFKPEKNIDLKEQAQEVLKPTNLLDKIKQMETTIQFKNIFDKSQDIVKEKVTPIKIKETTSNYDIQKIDLRGANSNLLPDKNIGLKEHETTQMNLNNVELKESSSDSSITNIKLTSNKSEIKPESNISAESANYRVDIDKIALENKNKNDDSIKINENIYGK